MESKRKGATEATIPPIVQTLEALRAKLSSAMEGRFSDYANNELLWQDRSKHILKPIEETDPPSVQLCKHMLMAMQDMESLIVMNQRLSAKGYIPRVGDNITDIYALLKLFYKGFVGHINKISELAAEANVPEGAMDALALVQSAFAGLAVEGIAGKGMTESMTKLFGQNSVAFGEALGKLQDTYFSHRPAPDEPESKYSVPPKPAEALGAQAQAEWFMLIEPVRDVTLITKGFASLARQCLDEAKKQGKKVNEEDLALIRNTEHALENARLTPNGFYEESKEDTPLSSSLKALYNMSWAVNELSRGHWNESSAVMYFNVVKNGMKALEHLGKIDVGGLGDNYKRIFNQLAASFLMASQDQLQSSLAAFTDKTHRVELKNHLRYGSLLDEVRSAFAPVQDLYLRYGVDLTNPFTSSESQKNELEANVARLRAEEKKDSPKKKEAAATLGTLLKKYATLGEVLSKKEKHVTSKVVSTAFYLTAPVSSLPSYVGGGVGQVYDAFMADMVFTPSMAVVEAGTKGAIDFLSAMNRSYQGFPREELLEAMVMAREAEVLKGSEYSIWATVENRVIAELSSEKKKAFIAKIKNEHALPDGSMPVHWWKLVQRMTKNSPEKTSLLGLVAAGAKGAWEGWPPPELATLVTTVERTNKALAEKRFALQANQEALVKRDQLLKEHSVRTLQREGLIPFLRAAAVVLEGPEKDPSKSHGMTLAQQNRERNIEQKRILATIISDILGENRADNLANAHERVQAFLANPLQMKQMVKNLYTSSEPEHKALGHALAVELVLAGYLKEVADMPEILVTDDDHVFRQDLIHALDRLEAAQALNLFGKPAGQFFALMISQGESVPALTTKLDWVNFLVQSYDKAKHVSPPDQEIMNKMGQFVGRLARSDAEMAKIVFANPGAREMVQQECAKNEATKAFYYEALVNDLFAGYVGDGDKQKITERALDVSSYSVLLEQNREIVLALHKAMHTRDPNSDEDVLKHYRENPWNLCELIERFISSKVSSDSLAENKLRGLFSAITLCSEQARKELFDEFVKFGGSANAKHIKLITPEASYQFWQKVQEDLIIKPGEEIFAKFDQQANGLFQLTSDPKMINKIKDEIAEQKTALASITEKLFSKDQNLFISCREAQQEMELVQRFMASKFKEWANEIEQANIKKLSQQVQNQAVQLSEALKKEFAAQEAKIEDLLKLGRIDATFAGKIRKEIQGYKSTATLRNPVAVTSQMEFEAESKALSLEASNLKTITEGKFENWSKQIKEKVFVTHNNITSLNKTTGQIQSILSQYYDDRKGLLASAFKAMKYPLRAEKLELVKSILDEISKLGMVEKQVDYLKRAERISYLLDILEGRHKELCDKYKGEPGDLGKEIEQIKNLFSPIKQSIGILGGTGQAERREVSATSTTSPEPKVKVSSETSLPRNMPTPSAQPAPSEDTRLSRLFTSSSETPSAEATSQKGPPGGAPISPKPIKKKQEK